MIDDEKMTRRKVLKINWYHLSDCSLTIDDWWLLNQQCWFMSCDEEKQAWNQSRSSFRLLPHDWWLMIDDLIVVMIKKKLKCNRDHISDCSLRRLCEIFWEQKTCTKFSATEKAFLLQCKWVFFFWRFLLQCKSFLKWYTRKWKKLEILSFFSRKCSTKRPNHGASRWRGWKCEQNFFSTKSSSSSFHCLCLYCMNPHHNCYKCFHRHAWASWSNWWSSWSSP